MATEHHDPVDVLVVGAGASGAAVAWATSGDTGLSVVCLERGRWPDPFSYPTTDPQWEIRRQHDFNPNPNVRRWREDYPIDDVDTPIKPILHNGVGGSTVMWSAHFPRFHPSDFRTKTLDGVADDWPITYEDLEPFYDMNDEITGVAGIHGDPANPPRSPRQTPPVPLGKGGELLTAAFDRLGWHWWPSDVATNTRPYGEDNRGACNNCGGMELGCQQLAKASTDITYWPKAVRNGVELRTEARVTEVTVDEDGRVSGARYWDRNGTEHFQPARVVVLGCNAIGTARLLLASRSERFPGGLANTSGLVGRNLMHHPLVIVVGVFEELLEGWKGPSACTFMSQEFYETDPARGYSRGYTLQALRSHGPAITALGGFGTTVAWGPDHHDRFDEVFGRTAALCVIAEDLPEEHNRVYVDFDRLVGDGMPTVVLEYTVGENSRRILDDGAEKAKQLLWEAGAVDLMINDLPSQSGFHLMGTARMGDDPATSVVNGWGETHDVENLFVVDGSVFVTSASVNPTSTIQAIALRAAGHIIERLS